MTVIALQPLAADAPPRRLRYQDQDSAMTLAEALEEYYSANAGRVLPPDTLPEASAGLFRRHDICHVIFGLDTTLADEAMADTRTILSCDVGLAAYAGYLKTAPEAAALFRDLGYARAAWITLKTLPRIMRAVGEVFRMRKKWPWTPPQSLMHRPLGELRTEFGIRVI